MVEFAFYGDDFTGSVDVLLQFRKAGVHGILVTSPEVPLPESDAAVIGIAGISRSLPTNSIEAELTPALTRLQALHPRLIQYKVCSTADSSAQIGSIGRAIEVGRALISQAPTIVSFAQPDFGRYTVFGHHFARDGDTVYRLDRQPTMRQHPVTPATESDLALHLAAQTELPIDSLVWTRLDDDAHLAGLLRGDTAIVVADALTDDDLDAIARALLADPEQRFVVGSGGISGAIARQSLEIAHGEALPVHAEPSPGPLLVLSGSTSARTTEQIDTSGWPVLGLFADDTPERAVQILASGKDVIVSSAGEQSAGSTEIEERLAFIGALCLHETTVGRLVICGGDTSGNVVRRLEVQTLEILAQPWGNVALLSAAFPDGRTSEIVLKGGQMGDPDLFARIRTGSASAADTFTKAVP